MSAANGMHDQAHVDQVLQYALGSLPASDVPVVEARLSECAECRQELHAMRPVVDGFVDWPTDVLRPSGSLWPRLAERIAGETGQAALPESPSRSAEPEWAEAAPGISVKLLGTDTDHNRVTMLVRLEPNTDYPPHRHAGLEELHLLQGVLIVDDRTLHPGDYIRSEPGTMDRRVWSGTGCTCVLITSFRDEIL